MNSYFNTVRKLHQTRNYLLNKILSITLLDKTEENFLDIHTTVLLFDLQKVRTCALDQSIVNNEVRVDCSLAESRVRLYSVVSSPDRCKVKLYRIFVILTTCKFSKQKNERNFIIFFFQTRIPLELNISEFGLAICSRVPSIFIKCS